MKDSFLKYQSALPLLLALLLTLFFELPSEAGLFHRKADPRVEAVQKVRTYQSPPADALATQCEPIRKKIYRLNSANKFQVMLNAPRVALLTEKHNKCRKRIMAQELEYLRHVDIEKGPSLPKMTSPSPDPAPSSP